MVAAVLRPTGRGCPGRPGTSARDRSGAAPRLARGLPGRPPLGQAQPQVADDALPERLRWSRRRSGTRRRCSRGRRRGRRPRWRRVSLRQSNSGTGSTSSQMIGDSSPAPTASCARLNRACCVADVGQRAQPRAAVEGARAAVLRQVASGCGVLITEYAAASRLRALHAGDLAAQAGVRVEAGAVGQAEDDVARLGERHRRALAALLGMPMPFGHCGQLMSAPEHLPAYCGVRGIFGTLIEGGAVGLVPARGLRVARGRRGGGRRRSSAGSGTAAIPSGAIRSCFDSGSSGASQAPAAEDGRPRAGSRSRRARCGLCRAHGGLRSSGRGPSCHAPRAGDRRSRESHIRDTAARSALAGGRAAGVDWSHDLHTPPRPPRPRVEIGVGALSFDDVVAVARGGAPVRLIARRPSRRSPAARAVVDELAAAPTPAYGISTGFGALATRHIPTEMRAQLQRSLVRSHAAGSGPEVEREVVRGADAAAPVDAGDRPDRRTPGDGAADGRDARTPGITPVVHEYGSLGCSGDLAPLSHCALALMGEGDGARRRRRADAGRRGAGRGRAGAGRAGRQGGPGADQRHRRHARDAGDGAGRPHACCCVRRTSRPPCRSRASSAPTGSSPPSCRRSGRTPARPPRPPTWSRCSRDSGVVASHRGPDCNRVQDAYSLRCSPQVHGAARDTLDHCAAGRRPGAGERGGQPGGAARATDRRSSPTATSTGRRSPTCWTSRRSWPPTSPRSASGVPTGSWTRPATTACRRSSPHDPGVDSGHMIAQYTQAAIVSEMKRLANPGQRRLDPLLARCRRTTSRWAGRPPASCAAPSTGSPGSSRSRCSPPPARSTCAARSSPRPPPARSSTCCAPPASRAPAPTATSRPRSSPPSSSSLGAVSVEAVGAVIDVRRQRSTDERRR